MKIREIFCENPRIIFILFYDVHKENMFRTNLEYGREAPSKASTINSVRSDSLSLKYQSFAPPGCIDIRFRKFEFVGKIQ